MAIERVLAYFEKFGISDRVMVKETSSATVELAAETLGVIPARIAKTLSFRVSDDCVLVVAAGDAKVDNAKYKNFFSQKAKMLTPDEAETEIGHAIGGVCPFGINENIKVYLDISLKRFETVFPACGSGNSMIELNLEELFKYSNAVEWIDVCKNWD